LSSQSPHEADPVHGRYPVACRAYALVHDCGAKKRGLCKGLRFAMEPVVEPLPELPRGTARKRGKREKPVCRKSWAGVCVSGLHAFLQPQTTLPLNA